MHKKITQALLMACLLWSLVACDDKSKTDSKKTSDRIVVAQSKATTTRLYYSGVLEPIKNVPVISPVDASITKLLFKYGDKVKKGQELMLLNSEQLAENYRKSVSDYLTKKETYQSGIKSYEGEVALHKAGVVSDEDYTSAKSTYDSNALAFYQSQLALEKVLLKAGVDFKQVENLTLSDPKTIQSILHRHFDAIVIRSPADGIVLFPSSGVGGKSTDKKNLAVGGDVKAGQVILTLGDLSGFASTVEVSEVNVNKMKVGLKAVITGDAFPGITLQGKVVSVASQANPSGGGQRSGLSMFNLVVEVHDVSAAQLQHIHVGMTSKIEIDIQNAKQIFLPVNAVFQKSGNSMVTLIDAKTGEKKDVPVLTGSTTAQSVAIVKGVKSGDKVVVHD